MVPYRLVSDRISLLGAGGLRLVHQLKTMFAIGPQPKDNKTAAGTRIMLPISFPIGSFGKQEQISIQ
jgi:hypothetical protein